VSTAATSRNTGAKDTGRTEMASRGACALRCGHRGIGIELQQGMGQTRFRVTAAPIWQDADCGHWKSARAENSAAVMRTRATFIYGQYRPPGPKCQGPLGLRILWVLRQRTASGGKERMNRLP